jgi:CRP-like cAMP-binding protein
MHAPAAQVLRELAVFSGISESGLREMANAGQRRELAAGTVVFDRGDRSDAAYVILRGRVELRRDGVTGAVLLAGDIFGELSVLHGTPRPARAVVTESLVALVLPAAALLEATKPRLHPEGITP